MGFDGGTGRERKGWGMSCESSKSAAPFGLIAREGGNHRLPAVMVHDALSFMVLLLIRRFPFRGHPPPPFGFLSLLPSPPRAATVRGERRRGNARRAWWRGATSRPRRPAACRRSGCIVRGCDSLFVCARAHLVMAGGATLINCDDLVKLQNL